MVFLNNFGSCKKRVEKCWVRFKTILGRGRKELRNAGLDLKQFWAVQEDS